MGLRFLRLFIFLSLFFGTALVHAFECKTEQIYKVSSKVRSCLNIRASNDFTHGRGNVVSCVKAGTKVEVLSCIDGTSGKKVLKVKVDGVSRCDTGDCFILHNPLNPFVTITGETVAPKPESRAVKPSVRPPTEPPKQELPKPQSGTHDGGPGVGKGEEPAKPEGEKPTPPKKPQPGPPSRETKPTRPPKPAPEAPKVTPKKQADTSAEDAARKLEEAAGKVRRAGTQPGACPDGRCGKESQAGRDTTPAVGGSCKPPIGKRSDLLMSVSASSCKEKCSGDSTCETYCTNINEKQCYSKCNTHTVIYDCRSKGWNWDDTYCAPNCSPFANCEGEKPLSRVDRAKEFIRYAQKAVKEALKDPANAHLAKIDQQHGGNYLARYLLCVNYARENPCLEPINRYNGACGEPAFGFGQVLDSTFMNNLGLRGVRANSVHPALKWTLREIANADPKKFSSNIFPTNLRKEVFQHANDSGKSYMDMTVEDLFKRRSFDVDFQARTMMAVFIGHARMCKGSFYGAWQTYAGCNCDGSGAEKHPKGQCEYGAIEACVRNNSFLNPTPGLCGEPRRGK